VGIWWRLYRPTVTDYAQIWHVGVTRHVLFHAEFQHARYIIFHLAGKDRRDNRIFNEIWDIVKVLIKSPTMTKSGVQTFACFVFFHAKHQLDWSTFAIAG